MIDERPLQNKNAHKGAVAPTLGITDLNEFGTMCNIVN